jgi:hypothetical protein
MDRLLADLLAVRRRSSRWASALVVVGGVALGGAVVRGIGVEEECVPAREKLGSIWDAGVRVEVREALRTQAQSGTGDAWLQLEPQLDAYASEWSDAYERACSDREAADEELALHRRLCLAAQLRRLGALSHQLAQGDVVELGRAAMAVPQWDRPNSCHDPEFLRGWVELSALQNAPAPQGSEDGLVSDFEGEPITRFGAGWLKSDDTLAGGDSEAALDLVDGGANGSAHAMKITGIVREHGRDWGWAGAMFFPGAQPMAPANLTDTRRIVFAVRGDPGTYVVMVFSQSRGWEPGLVPFNAAQDWSTVEIATSDFAVPLYDVTGIFIGKGDDGRFELFIDDVRLETTP